MCKQSSHEIITTAEPQCDDWCTQCWKPVSYCGCLCRDRFYWMTTIGWTVWLRANTEFISRSFNK